MGYLKEILPKMVQYRLTRRNAAPSGMPLNLTFSVTNICQSRCRTCRIWELYKKDPAKRATELTISEIDKIFRSMGHVYVFNISGGEPFLRPDIGEIVALACRHLTPGIIHIPTNAIAIERVYKKVNEILTFLEQSAPAVHLTVKPSLDHIGEGHDEIRGVNGNFKKVMALFHRLKALQPDFPNLHVELGTVISRWNVNDIDDIAAFVTTLGSDSYRNEIAEQRSEMFNSGDAITPEPDAYEKAIAQFVRQIRSNMQNRSFFHRITSAFRLVYYDLAVRTLKEQRQLIPCYAAISNAHLSPYGDVWACCTLGYDKTLGNLREFAYDFRNLWQSPRAEAVRAEIRKGVCYCPLANQLYSNMLFHAPSLLRVAREMIRG